MVQGSAFRVHGSQFTVQGLGLGFRVKGAHGAREGAWTEKFQVYDDFPPTHVSHNIMKQRFGEDATACCYCVKLCKTNENEQNTASK